MANYTYKCDNCNSTKEINHPINIRHIETCKKCNTEMHRVIFASPVIYKCGGFCGRSK